MFIWLNIVYVSLFTVKDRTNPQHLMAVNSKAGLFPHCYSVFHTSLHVVSFKCLSLPHSCPERWNCTAGKHLGAE